MNRSEPEWWAMARLMKEQDNFTYKEISIVLEKSLYAIGYALNPKQREDCILNKRSTYVKVKNVRSKEQKLRSHFRRKARHLAEDTGRPIKECYIELGVL